jgi:cellobiose dehydrogenase (acceptor)
LAIDLGGATDTSHSTQGVLVIAWAQALPAPLTPSDPNSDIVQHDNGMGIFGFPVAGAVQAKYANWIAALPVETGTPTSVAPTSTATPTTTTTKFPYIPVPTGTWDYIVAGGGAGGIPVAANVAATGKKTLLIERGPPSLARWGGSKSI